jgi:hypothetical protein
MNQDTTVVRVIKFLLGHHGQRAKQQIYKPQRHKRSPPPRSLNFVVLIIPQCLKGPYTTHQATLHNQRLQITLSIFHHYDMAILKARELRSQIIRGASDV